MEAGKKKKNNTTDIETAKRHQCFFFGTLRKKDTASNSNKESGSKKIPARSLQAATAEKLETNPFSFQIQC